LPTDNLVRVRAFGMHCNNTSPLIVLCIVTMVLGWCGVAWSSTLARYVYQQPRRDVGLTVLVTLLYVASIALITLSIIMLVCQQRRRRSNTPTDRQHTPYIVYCNKYNNNNDGNDMYRISTPLLAAETAASVPLT